MSNGEGLEHKPQRGQNRRLLAPQDKPLGSGPPKAIGKKRQSKQSTTQKTTKWRIKS